ncbi:hypothetical protein [Dysgonomonas reticulitermitis]
MNKKKKFLGALIFLAVFAAAIAIVMLLWNALIPSIIGWTAINYWQAAGLMLLCRLLLGGFGRFGKFGRFGHHHHHKFHKRKKEEMIAFREKMKDMSRDERSEYIRERMRPDFFEREDNAEPKE